MTYRVPLVLVALLSTGCLAGGTSPAIAQEVDVGGTAFLDYYYHVAAPDEDLEGLHGFTYRRLYLTTDFVLSEDIRGRARLEASDASSGSRGPQPFVKDLFLTWRYFGDHTLTFGLTPPEAFTVAESVWGYRSLEQTIQDLDDVAPSREMGVKANGPLSDDGRLMYVIMLGNNNGTRVENDRYKRGYFALQAFPGERLLLSLGGDYAGYGGDLDGALRLHAFGGYRSDRWRAGVESYWISYSSASGLPPVDDGKGLSLFGSADLSSQWEVVGRIDFSSVVTAFEAEAEQHYIFGITYVPTEQVRFIPNIIVMDRENAKAAAVARLTVELRF